MSQIRPSINTELIKVMTGMWRCGRSVILRLIQEELLENSVNSEQFICINFEDMRYSHLLTAEALHDEIAKSCRYCRHGIYFFDNIQKSKTGRKALIHFVLLSIVIYTLQAPTQSFYLVS